MSARSIFDLVNYLSALSILIPLAAILAKRKGPTRELKALFIYLLVCGLTEGTNFILAANNIQNYFVQNLFTVVECSILTFVYLLRFERKSSKIAVLIFYSIFFLLSTFQLTIQKKLNESDSLLSAYEALFIIVMSILFFYKEINESEPDRLSTNRPFHFINSAFLLYFGASFLLFLFNDFIENIEIQKYYWIYGCYFLVNIAYNSLLGLGLWKVKTAS